MKNLILFSLLFILIACHRLTEGRVIGRRYEPSYVSYDTHYAGKHSYTTPVYHAEKYYVLIEGYYKGEKREEYFSVDKETYHSTKTGDYFYPYL
jgi:hypothetical protein